MYYLLSPQAIAVWVYFCVNAQINRAVGSFHNLEWQKHLNNSDKTCQLRNAIKYDVLFVIAYFNIPENIIQLINIIQWIILHSLAY